MNAGMDMLDAIMAAMTSEPKSAEEYHKEFVNYVDKLIEHVDKDDTTNGVVKAKVRMGLRHLVEVDEKALHNAQKDMAKHMKKLKRRVK